MALEIIRASRSARKLLERKAYIRIIAGRTRASRRYLMRARVRDTGETISDEDLRTAGVASPNLTNSYNPREFCWRLFGTFRDCSCQGTGKVAGTHSERYLDEHEKRWKCIWACKNLAERPAIFAKILTVMHRAN